MIKKFLKYKYILRRENGEVVDIFNHYTSAIQFQTEYFRDFREELKIEKKPKTKI